ncbi:plastocyanin/azurin family copper-binding protein [Halorubrum trueperi]|uniref:Plastocyanin/azurin family copper-binding protein n=1 Tax=Halorubrum trueperi TaxID=2004704 RepID=A0ABD5UKR7_9EURY
MVANDKSTSNEESNGIIDRSRRNVLKITGAGAGLATLGAFSMTGAGQEDETTPTDDSGASDHFIADLTDPVFGYPLAQGETEDLSVEHVVDVMVQEGSGDHESFPEEPDEDAPGELLEVPAEFFFDPVGLHVEPSEVVHFNDVSGLHTVTAFHDKFVDGDLQIPNRVPEDVPGFTSPPMMPGESWVYQFNEKGVYDYFCFPHLGLGMVGRIVVFDPEEDDVESEEFSAPEGELFPNDERVLSAEELEPANIVEQGSVAWADLTISEQSPAENGTETETES